MTHGPFHQGKADEFGADLEPTVADLERYGADSAAEPSRGFADRVMEVVETEPVPRRGVLAWLATTFSTDRGRVALLAATVAVAVLAVLATGQLARLLPSQFGGTPQPSQSVPASPEPSPSVTPQVSPSASPSPSTPVESSASPSEDESDASDAPDGLEEPEPSPSPTDGNSGPGGGDEGGGGSSGRGGGSSSPGNTD